MALIVSTKGFGNNCVRKGKEGSLLPSAVLQCEVALQVLIVQHVLHPIPGHIPACTMLLMTRPLKLATMQVAAQTYAY